MNFYVKRLFLNSNHTLNNISKKILYINSPNDYVKNKFFSMLSQKLYNVETNFLYFHDNFKTNYINHILIPELNLFISSLYNKNKTLTINLNNVMEKYPIDKINPTISKINETEKIFSSNLNQIRNLFNLICKNHTNNLNLNIFNEFVDEFINHTFKNSNNFSNNKPYECFISSVGIYGFKTFSNYIPDNENKIFVINDDFNLFKNIFVKKLLDKSKLLNIPYEIFKNPLDKNVIDHIKFPSLNLCIISNDFLFKEKIPGIQINEELFLKNNIKDMDFLNQKNNLEVLIKNFNELCNSLKNEYSLINNFLEDHINKNKLSNLVNYTLKNVIR